MQRIFGLATAAILTATAGYTATSGTVVALGDEWMFSDQAFSSSATNQAAAEQLADNLAALVGGSNYVFASTGGIGLGTTFETYLESAPLGKTVTRTNTQAGFDAGLANADVMFLLGTVGNGTANFAALDAFVANGGSVVVTLGAGWHGGNAATGGALEANAWNPFLQTYGMTALAPWGPSAGITPITDVDDGPTTLDDGVDSIYWGFGNYIDLFGVSDAQLVTGSTAGGTEISAMGVWSAAPVPLPAGVLLLPAGLLALGALRRRCRKAD